MSDPHTLRAVIKLGLVLDGEEWREDERTITWWPYGPGVLSHNEMLLKAKQRYGDQVEGEKGWWT